MTNMYRAPRGEDGKAQAKLAVEREKAKLEEFLQSPMYRVRKAEEAARKEILGGESYGRLCRWCLETIPVDTWKRGHGQLPKTCNKECDANYRAYFQYYTVWAMISNIRQLEYKAANGEIPGYSRRAEALSRPDRTNTRRRK